MNRRATTLVLLALNLILAGCAVLTPTPEPPPLSQRTPALEESPTPTQNEAPPTPPVEQTIIPIEAVTDLPEHAPTVTLPEEPVVTTVIEPTPAETAGGEAASDSENITPPDAPFSEAEIQISRPGAYSKYISPLRVHATILSAPTRVQVTLIGEDGRILYRERYHVNNKPMEKYDNLLATVEFKLPGLAEAGRVLLSINDEFGRMAHATSIEVILLSTGSTVRNHTQELQERILIQQPIPNYMVQGDILLVTGLLRTPTGKPLLLAMTDENGKVLAAGTATTAQLEGQEYIIFVGEISYSVEQPTWVRLSVAIQGERVPGIIYLTSLEIVVSP